MNPKAFAALVRDLAAGDPEARMSAADAAEKITRSTPRLLQPHKRALLRLAATTTQKEVRWHLAQMLPRLELTDAERERAFRLMEAYLVDASSIVKTFAMQALVDLSTTPALRDTVTRHVRELAITGTPAMRARGRILIKSLTRSKR